MNHNKLKAALTKFKDITVKEQILGDYTPEEINEIWAVLQLPESEQITGQIGKEAIHSEKNDTDLKLEIQHNLENKLCFQEQEIERLKAQLVSTTPAAPASPALDSSNNKLTIPAPKDGVIEGEDFQRYLEVVRGLDQHKPYDWSEYNAIGVWKTVEDQNGDMMETNILVGIRLINPSPLKNTRMEPRHIEYWMTGQRGRKVMGGLNAQIYDKSNDRRNSRYYLLKQV